MTSKLWSIARALTYDDVLLEPQYSEIKSRADVNISWDLDTERKLALPIISSPMDTVTEWEMGAALASAGGLGIIHRYNSVEKQVELVKAARSQSASDEPEPLIGAAVGVSGDFAERAQAVHAAGANIICIDVAHGHHILVKEAIKELKGAFGESVHLMAGNVATADGYVALSAWGADSVRCNVGGGSICSTRIQTGHGVPGLYTLFKCADVKTGAKIIADGGIKNSGDIVKAYAAGADFVMLGSLLAGTAEAPGKTLSTKDGRFKTYRGMASKEAQLDWRGEYSSNEGVTTAVPCKGPVAKVLGDLENGIRSGLSYSGARNIADLRFRARFLQQTPAGQKESSTHIFNSRG